MCLVRTVDGIGEVRLSGPPAHLPILYTGFEDYHHPRLARLRDRYKIDEAVDGVVGEFDRFLSLRNWVHSQWVLDQSQTVSGDALEILEQASRGVRFCCGHMALNITTSGVFSLSATSDGCPAQRAINRGGIQSLETAGLL